jgi:hypothetical protein
MWNLNNVKQIQYRTGYSFLIVSDDGLKVREAHVERIHATKTKKVPFRLHRHYGLSM